jgi:hypothetical protein
MKHVLFNEKIPDGECLAHAVKCPPGYVIEYAVLPNGTPHCWLRYANVVCDGTRCIMERPYADLDWYYSHLIGPVVRETREEALARCAPMGKWHMPALSRHDGQPVEYYFW